LLALDGVELIGSTTRFSPHLTTIWPPPTALMARFGERLRQKGSPAGERNSGLHSRGDLDRVVEPVPMRFLSASSLIAGKPDVTAALEQLISG